MKIIRPPIPHSITRVRKRFFRFSVFILLFSISSIGSNAYNAISGMGLLINFWKVSRVVVRLKGNFSYSPRGLRNGRTGGRVSEWPGGRAGGAKSRPTWVCGKPLVPLEAASSVWKNFMCPFADACTRSNETKRYFCLQRRRRLFNEFFRR